MVKKETAPQQAPAAAAKPEGAAPAAGGEHKKATVQGSSKAKPTYVDGKCHGAGCKANSTRMDFCAEHYDQFKFGLIKRTGELVSDWEKKSEHYAAFKQRSATARKAA
jgi:hypothetical protein